MIALVLGGPMQFCTCCIVCMTILLPPIVVIHILRCVIVLIDLGLFLGRGLHSIPTELLQKVHNSSYVELSVFLPERIRVSFLYPDRI